MTGLSPWLALVGLGAFHGLNPAMGWLFAVALGLHRDNFRTTVVAVAPIAAGHMVSVALVALAVVLAGLVIEERPLTIACGTALIGWALYHLAYGHRHRVRIGMTTGMAGLAVWSFLMATAHGAGLMLVPVIIPLCLAGSPAGDLTASGSLTIALAAIATHTISMLVVTLVIAVAVYRWFGLGFLRRGWINVDLIWVAALIATGIILILQ